MLPAILAGLMGVKGLLDANRERQQKLAQSGADASAIRFSPWSGLNVSNLVGKDYSSASPLSGAVQGGLSGGVTGMNIENSMQDQDLRNKLADYMTGQKEQSSTWTPYSPLGGGYKYKSNLNPSDFGVPQ